MQVTALRLAFVGMFAAGLALAQGTEPENSRQPGVIEKWSSELLEAVDHKVAAAEQAVRIMEELRQRRSAPGADVGSLAPEQWPEAYAEVLSHQAAASVQNEMGSALRSYPSLPLIVDLSIESRTSRASSYQMHQWEPFVRQILKSEGLPLELLAVPLVESGFNPSAMSPKGARGLWQLMPETARRFGLRVDALLDERTDPLRSTVAAISYLKELYGSLGNWPLALAAYNAGFGKVAEAMARGGPTFAALAARKLLPAETLRYDPLVLGTSDAKRWRAGVPDRGSPAMR